MTEHMTVFNRQAVRQHRDRAANGLGDHDFLFRESAERLADRVDDVTREFDLALDLGCHGGELSAALKDHQRIQRIIQSDLSPAMAHLAKAGNRQETLVIDEEALPFGEKQFDLILSNLSLHWVNDLPGCFRQIQQSLKPDGLFLATLLGGETLRELRHALNAAEVEIENGLSARLSPFADLKDVGNLLTRAGFTLPVADKEVITVSYPDAFKLMSDLRGMGENNANVLRRKGFSRRGTLLRAAEICHQKFSDENGRIPVTFEVMYLTAWAPHESQPKPLKPGSATSRLVDFFKEPGTE